PAGRHRHRAPATLQGQRLRGRAQVREVALPAGLRDLRGGQRLSAARRRRLHPAQRAPSQDPRAPRPALVRIDVVLTADGIVPARVRDRTIVLTTSNGTRALTAVRGAGAVAVAALVNAGAAAAWAERRGTDVVLVCSGSLGAPSLEDEVCAGVLVARLVAEAP